MSVSDYRRNQAFVAGRKAALAGKDASACNRQRGTIYFDDWQDGFMAAREAMERNG